MSNEELITMEMISRPVSMMDYPIYLVDDDINDLIEEGEENEAIFNI